MALQSFLDNFELFGEAPKGVGKLRELILQLAVEGKLVSQNPNDESASVLLERIQSKRAKERKQKKESPLPLANGNLEPPFEIPSSWIWARLLEVGHEWGQKRPDIRFTYIDVSSIDNERGVITDQVKRLEPSDAPSRARKIVKQGTVIYSTVRPYLLNIAIVDKKYSPEPIASTAFAVIHPFEGVSANYLYSYLRSRTFIDFVEAQMQGVAYPAINAEKLFTALVPLPPSEEQKRIVTKVDGLMRLCDELEARREARREIRMRLSNVTLAPLNKAASLGPQEFAQASVRLTDNFEALYDSPDTVGSLRSTILQLALQGKLVPQNSDDEPASLLVTRIKKQRREVTDTKIATVEKMHSIKADEISFSIPDGWRWTRLAEVCELITKGSSPNWQGITYVNEGEGILFVTSENVGSYQMLFDNRKFVETRFNDIEPRSILKRNDLLMNIVGASIGRAALFDSNEVANINQAVCLIRVADHSLVPYLLHFFNSETCIQMMFDKQVDNARANLSMGNIAKFPIPLPPLEEQTRIVSKINQLMALCDEVEGKLRQAEVNSEKLMKVAIRHVLSAINKRGSETNTGTRRKLR